MVNRNRQQVHAARMRPIAARFCAGRHSLEPVDRVPEARWVLTVGVSRGQEGKKSVAGTDLCLCHDSSLFHPVYSKVHVLQRPNAVFERSHIPGTPRISLYSQHVKASRLCLEVTYRDRRSVIEYTRRPAQSSGKRE